MTKRRKFVLASLLLSTGFIALQFLTDQNRFWAIGILAILTIVFFVWSLWGTLEKNMTLLTLILPAVFTLGVGLFWFLLPTNIYTRIPIIIFYGIGMYVLLLTMNIFTVSAIRTIALLRAAKGVGFVLTLVTSFLIFDAIMSLKTEIYVLPLLVFLVSFPLYLQAYWTVFLEKSISKDLLLLSAISALVTTEISVALYFWPVTVVVGSLFLTVSFYVLLGLGQAKIDDRLFSSTVREHLFVGALVFAAMFIATHWGG